MSIEAYQKGMEEREKKDQELQALRNEQQMLKEHMAKMEESQLKITELLEVMKIAKSSDGKAGKNKTMLDEKRSSRCGQLDQLFLLPLLIKISSSPYVACQVYLGKPLQPKYQTFSHLESLQS